MLHKNIFAIIFTVIIAILSGCSETTQPGSDYIGTWVKIDDQTRKMDIRKNGDNYVINVIGGFFPGEMAATLKDGTLVTPDLASFFIDKTSGNLKTDKGVVYKRVE